ncbi:SGNH/GDSL hydrolase family protein [Bacillus pseudomycoides]|uniref:SGNH/GDSL hydrolase family protein n=1 Tax=Bacillus bingmayongensis TaxID=1150157 RepID=A0ABU5JUG0_9BACI|nr:SGNH/GDSL hydrolase family protein [Bacillus pseudomycoides]
MKKTLIFIVSLFIALIVSLYLFLDTKTNINSISSPSKNTDNTNESKKDITKSEKQQTDKSVINFLEHISSTKGKVKIVALGDSVTFGIGAFTEKGSRFSNAWGGLLAKYLNNDVANIRNATVINKGFPRRSTSELLKEKRVDEVIRENPDLVIFEVCLFNNQSKAVSLAQTNLDIDTIVSQIQTKLPNTLILIQSPNPSTSRTDKRTNRIGLTYQDYLTSTKEHIKNKEWHYIDTYKSYQEILNKKHLQLEETLISDGIHPNNKGYMVWFEVLKEAFSKPLS